MAHSASLLTTFTPLPSCSETAVSFFCDTLSNGDASCAGLLYPVSTETTSCHVVHPTECNPTAGFYQTYSPGLYCPYGWTSAVTISYAPNGALVATGEFSTAYWTPNPDETFVYCCPS